MDSPSQLRLPLAMPQVKGAAVDNKPHARDDVGTKLETTGKEVLSKIVIVNNSFIQDSWTHKKIKKNKTFPTATEASSFDPASHLLEK